MKFEIGDSSDQSLVVSLSHEYMRASESFYMFCENEERRARLPDKRLSIRSYNLYVDFLCHLYEFYVGCIKRDRRDTKEIPHGDLDRIFTFEAQKLMNLKRERIERGEAPSWENDISVYRVEVPSMFGEHFRWIRNRNNHVDLRRADGTDISLSDFFAKYHFYVYNMFSYSAWLWNVKSVYDHNFKEIENFSISVSKHLDEYRKNIGEG